MTPENHKKLAVTLVFASVADEMAQESSKQNVIDLVINYYKLFSNFSADKHPSRFSQRLMEKPQQIPHQGLHGKRN